MVQREREAIYFISDSHFGLQSEREEQLKLEKLERLFAMIREGGRSLYMLGDIFDYWMEFRHVIPKGFSRVLCLLYDLSRSGVEVVYVAGNHDFYLGNYFERELGLKTYYGLNSFDYAGRTFLFAHGDGLGDGDLGYKLFARFVRKRFNLGLLTAFHADLTVGLMKKLSYLSRHHKPADIPEESNRLLNFAESIAEERDFDYFVCGHNHAQGIHRLRNGASRYVNLGTWIDGTCPYGVFMHDAFHLKEL
ncbi:MAG: UDP-2,3-diacylglucosamine diphosphatase [Chlorobium sp.]|jgi:UDP-2,3-diacylglucosamine hydrolase|uniref:UDP-2,3-diacylglucosamine diphosphatase n=1 Tax=Chlorobium sp. TaxID=1095 RepID=UPI001DAB5EB3|nr:UDP-2,3-diacylglucosamine diphosphatase [Chlorobium sp.]MBN1278230.1 UDP-2,3-diacylglucosamine diphosphatase [Chlorobiaceae bacterium]MCF8215444.1 UDP-2,3-diacylglucosamine diphosphatase [Chlorobium sp.]MCF8270331.1 UDP-2,3-diacylglucosamine diphosphatase [Chlorobium sp.]MCF8286651.1 UDP-2,3-diacylglucosamine diphosphatase [Chlorobium sp.]MCF8290344.1 UDP-2,3-diacylglucosamine diphosphatase [Chlorobium sp.]